MTLAPALRDSRFGRAIAAWEAHRYALLFYSLLAVIAVLPLRAVFGLDAHLIETLLGINLIAAASTFDGGWARYGILVLILGALLARIAAAGLQLPGLMLLLRLVWPAIAMVATLKALSDALRAPVVKGEHLYAVLAAYLMIGIFFGVFASVLASYVPDSFAIAGVPIGPEFALGDAIYFSFVTLATLGYGDIVPLSDAARGLATTEAIGGQLYIAVLVARLVSARGGTA